MKDLLREYIELILEGFKENQDSLIQKYPGFEHVLKTMNPKEIEWLYGRFMSDKRIEEVHPFEDALETLKTYSAKSVGINQKYASNRDFKASVDAAFPNQGRRWNTPADFRFMSSDDMAKIIRLSVRKKQRFDIGEYKLPMEDFIGKFGEWNLWMPSTRENSVKIALYDPETMEPKTTWCTARTAGSNLFYNYAGKGIILFYIIKDNPIGDDDWLSVGFIDGEIQFNGYGTESVNGKNEGLTEESLRSILGSSYNSIMNKMKEKVKNLKGKHPAREQIEKARKDPKAYFSFIKGLSAEETLDLKHNIINGKLSDEVFLITIVDPDIKEDVLYGYKNKITPELFRKMYALNDSYIKEWIAGYIGDKSNLPPPQDIIELLCNDEDVEVRRVALGNPSAPAKLLIQNANDLNVSIRQRIALNPSTPIEVLKTYVSDEDENVRVAALKNKNATDDMMRSLANDSSVEIRKFLARGAHAPGKPYRTPKDVILSLVNDPSDLVKAQLANNERQITSKMLSILSKSSNFLVKNAVALNPRTDAETLAKLVSDNLNAEDQSAFALLARFVAQHRKTPVNTLKFLAGSSTEVDVLERLAARPGIPLDVLKILASKNIENINYRIAMNKNTSPEMLDYLAKKSHSKSNITNALTLNKKTSPDTLRFITTEYLAELQKQPNMIPRNVVSNIARHNNTPPDLIKSLFDMGNDSINIDIAGNSSTPESILRTLATSNKDLIIQRLGVNKSTPLDVLKTLLYNTNKYSKMYIIKNNKNIPIELLKSLFEVEKNASVRNEIKKQLEKRGIVDLLRECVRSILLIN